MVLSVTSFSQNRHFIFWSIHSLSLKFHITGFVQRSLYVGFATHKLLFLSSNLEPKIVLFVLPFYTYPEQMPQTDDNCNRNRSK